MKGELSSPALRRLPRRGVRRVLSALLLWTLARSVAELIARALLGFRQRGQLTTTPSGLHLSSEARLLGRVWKSQTADFTRDGVASITLLTGGASARFAAGLAALCLGTYFGAGFFAEALLAPSGAVSLLGLSLLLVAVGVGIDYFLARSDARAERPATLRLLTSSGEGWELRGIAPGPAEDFLAQARRALQLEQADASSSRDDTASS